MKSFIPFFKINYDHNEIREIKSVLNSGMLTMGSKTDLFENKIAKKLNIKKNNVAAVSNCTVALHLALISANTTSACIKNIKIKINFLNIIKFIFCTFYNI